jgi:hypothetical protein
VKSLDRIDEIKKQLLTKYNKQYQSPTLSKRAALKMAIKLYEIELMNLKLDALILKQEETNALLHAMREKCFAIEMEEESKEKYGTIEVCGEKHRLTSDEAKPNIAKRFDLEMDLASDTLKGLG